MVGIVVVVVRLTVVILSHWMVCLGLTVLVVLVLVEKPVSSSNTSSSSQSVTQLARTVTRNQGVTGVHMMRWS